MRYHYTPTRMVKIKNSKKKKIVTAPNAGRDAEKLAHLHCSWECKMAQQLQKTVW